MAEPASRPAIGVAAMLGACCIWGLSPLFYKLIADVPPADVLAHRTIWSALCFWGVLALRGRAGGVVAALGSPRQALLIAVAATAISLNWGGFIFSVQAGHVVEASLGYYIFPLASVALGAVVFGERLSVAQGAAVGLAGVAVAMLILGLGVTPWISLLLAGTFAVYGVLKKVTPLDAMTGVTAEVVLLLPLALLWLWFMGEGAFRGGTALLLIATGPLTAVPLMLFGIASRRLSMATVGLIQYVNPSLQAFCALVVFGEAATIWHGAAFALIWTALALYSGDGLRRRGRARGAVPVPR